MHKNKSGRYQIDDNHYFTFGSPIEILYHNDFYEQIFWIRTRIEHNGYNYYAVAIPDVSRLQIYRQEFANNSSVYQEG
ncbi:DUF5348 domain-containing protein [Fontibacillus panacisegetis]|uniref:DUF5348 domain-containing protein n=1 Tax=Fontibacillus panacisegetis TaxID=670482 RepID=UPI00158702F0